MSRRDIEAYEPVDPAAVAADDLLVEEIVSGRCDRDDPMVDLLATWRAETVRSAAPVAPQRPSRTSVRRQARRSRSKRAGAVVAGVGLLVSTGIGQAVADDPVAPLRYVVTKGVELGSGLGSPLLPAEQREIRGAAGSAHGGLEPGQAPLTHEPAPEHAADGAIAPGDMSRKAPGDTRDPRPNAPAEPSKSRHAAGPDASHDFEKSKSAEAPEQEPPAQESKKARKSDEPEAPENDKRARDDDPGSSDNKQRREGDEPSERQRWFHPSAPEEAESTSPPPEDPGTEPADPSADENADPKGNGDPVPEKSDPPDREDPSPQAAQP